MNWRKCSQIRSLGITQLGLAEVGGENGDICSGDSATITIGSNTWTVQRMYSRRQCQRRRPEHIFLDSTYGIGRIYTADEIEKAKASPSFEREYNLKYLGKIWNVFHTKNIEAAIEK